MHTFNDSDKDGLPDIRDPDSCPQVTNPDLPDSDGDGLADVCEAQLQARTKSSSGLRRRSGAEGRATEESAVVRAGGAQTEACQ
jgi:hypothetical protein